MTDEKDEIRATQRLWDDKVMLIMLALCFVLLLAIIVVQFLETPAFQKPAYTPAESLEQPENNASEANFPIGINSATYEELQTIPGVGPATARLIIKFREENGTIVSLDELLAAEGIGEKTVSLLADYCVVD